ncbi:MAG: DNA polymerase I [Syntrophaceae bacterium]
MQIYLIDGSSYIYRAFYAMREMSTSTGLPTNAVYILTRMLVKLLKDKAPEYIAFVLDPKGPTHRHEQYQAYKATRQRMPEALRAQFPYILEMVGALGIPILQMEKEEADDIIATLARRFKSQAQVVIISGDKDLMQLVDDSVIMWDTLKGQVYDRAAVEVKFKVAPEYIADLLAIMGDSSDNIPGIPGIGEKGAVDLITKLGHLDQIIAQADSLTSEKQKKAIKENIELARLSLALACLDRDAAFEAGLTDLALKDRDEKRLTTLFQELEFKALLAELGQAALPASPVHHGRIEHCSDPEISGENGFFIVRGLGSAVAEHDVTRVCLDEKAYLAPLARKDATLILHDAKEALVLAKQQGIRIQADVFDTLLAAYSVDAASSGTRLEELARSYLGRSIPTLKDLLGSGRGARDLNDLSQDERGSFLAAHAEALPPLMENLTEHMARVKVERIYHEIEIPLTFVLADLEALGVLVDTAVLAGISDEITETTAELERKIYDLSGRCFNINSPQQLAKVLFEDLQLPVIKKTKTGVSTDSSVLEALAAKHEVPAKILEYRMLTKLKNTYVDTLPTMIDPTTGRVHTRFNQAVTATGRISSSDPNLQNIPIRTAIGRRIRGAFVAPPGYQLLSADYSQIELRILAHITKDQTLTESFRQEVDIHARTAAEVFGLPLGEVTSDMRRQAKVINFGIIYGMGAHRLSGELGITRATAQRYIENYLAKYPGVREYMDAITRTASEQGFVTTMLGRRRTIPEINSANFNEREAARRIAINTPIQGSAADIIKMAMVKIQAHLKNMKSRMILQVHDELVFEAAEGEIEELKSLVIHEMENAYPMDVPVKVDVGVGPNWAAAH